MVSHISPDQSLEFIFSQTEDYPVTVNEFSDFLEVDLLPDTSTATVKSWTNVLNTMERMLLLLQIMFHISNQQIFRTLYVFGNSRMNHTSSYYHSQSNRKADKISKNIVCKSRKMYDGLWKSILGWRNNRTVDSNRSQKQGLMSRRTCVGNYSYHKIYFW